MTIAMTSNSVNAASPNAAEPHRSSTSASQKKSSSTMPPQLYSDVCELLARVLSARNRQPTIRPERTSWKERDGKQKIQTAGNQDTPPHQAWSAPADTWNLLLETRGVKQNDPAADRPGDVKINEKGKPGRALFLRGVARPDYVRRTFGGTPDSATIG